LRHDNIAVLLTFSRTYVHKAKDLKTEAKTKSKDLEKYSRGCSRRDTMSSRTPRLRRAFVCSRDDLILSDTKKLHYAI